MTADGDAIGSAVAREWVTEVHQLQSRTRAIRQGFWLPLVLLGLVILASTPLYFNQSEAAQLGLPAGTVFKPRPASMAPTPVRLGKCPRDPTARCVVDTTCVAVRGVVYTPCYVDAIGRRPGFRYFPGGRTTSPRAVAIYWLVTLPIAYLLIGLWYYLRSRRKGVSTSPLAYVLVGISLLALLVLSSVHRLLHLPAWATVLQGDIAIRGLAALLTIGLGLFVLSYLERSWTLLVFSGIFFALALLANLYNVENIASLLGYTVGPEFGVFLAGLFLFGGGIGFALLRRRST
jgi:hypothetical protein